MKNSKKSKIIIVGRSGTGKSFRALELALKKKGTTIICNGSTDKKRYEESFPCLKEYEDKDSHYSFAVEKDGKYYICAKDYKSTATEFVNALILGCSYGNLGHDKNATVVYDDSAWVASKNNILTLWQLSHADCNIIITADSLSEILKIKPSELSEKDSLSEILKIKPSELSEKMIKDICTYWDIIHL